MPPKSNWHEQWIAVDPRVLDGEPHVRGTNRTVADIQAFWKQKGVYAKEIRARFPDLTEAQLGAAVTYAPHVDPVNSYVAEWIGPPHRKYYLWRDRDAPEGHSDFSGWMFQETSVDAEGQEQPGWDVWEATLAEVLRYPREYGPREIIWSDERTGDVVDIYALKE